MNKNNFKYYNYKEYLVIVLTITETPVPFSIGSPMS